MLLSSMEEKALLDGDPMVILANLIKLGWKTNRITDDLTFVNNSKDGHERIAILPKTRGLPNYKKLITEVIYAYAQFTDIPLYCAICQLTDGRNHKDISDAPKDVHLLLKFENLGVLFLGMRDPSSSKGMKLLSPAFEILPPDDIGVGEYDDWAVDIAQAHGLDGLDQYVSISQENFCVMEPHDNWTLKEWSVMSEVPFLRTEG